MPDLLVDWATGLRSAGWRFSKGAGKRTVPIPWLAYLRAPSHLNSRRASARFDAISRSSAFRDWWLQECGGDDRSLKRFALRFPQRVWDIPWELLIGELAHERRPRISIVRMPEGEPRSLPSNFDRPMSVLLVQGDDGSSCGWARLDLDHEAKRLLDAYDRLPASHHATLLRPKVLKPSLEGLRTELLDANLCPDVIFLSGHATSRPPVFLLADGSRLTPEAFAGILAAAPARPLYIVFWACDTGALQTIGAIRQAAPFSARFSSAVSPQ